jgi:NADH dehydrogenase
MKIVILGAGVGGTYTAVELERLAKRRADLDVTLVSRDNFYTMTPLLFEAASGSVEVRHVVSPIRAMLRTTRFVRADVTQVDFAGRVVRARDSAGVVHELPYDQLVVALGGAPRYDLVPGAPNALAFKTIEDAIALRTHVLDAFERAMLERDPARRAEILRIVVVGGGLVGVELAGELSHFVASLRKTYASIAAHEVSVHVIEAAPRLVPELDPVLAAYIERTYARRGIRMHTGTTVERIAPDAVTLAGGETLAAGTIVYAAGLAPNPLVATFPLDRDRRGRIATDETLRSTSHADVWALGDNAAIPVPGQPGQTYPPLAQHAHREAKTLARNLVRVLDGKAPRPFVYESKGTAALLGSYRAVAKIGGVRVRGFVAWWLWRTLYLFRVPGWERRLRVIADWTVGLLFPADSAQVRLPAPAPAAPPVTASASRTRTA